MKRQCKDCQEWFPETSKFFKPNKDKGGKTYLSHRCKACRRIKARTTVPGSLRKAPPPDLVLATHNRLCTERGQWVTWQAVADELGIKYSSVIYVREILRQQGRLPTPPVRKKVASNRDFIRDIENWLNRLNIGDRNDTVAKRLRLIQERAESALAHEKRAMTTLVASRLEIVKLRREIARLEGLRDKKRLDYERGGKRLLTIADEGYGLAEAGD